MRTPAALAERLGEPASVALLEMFDASERTCLDHTVRQSTERFERRLVEEASKLRVEIAQLRSDLREAMATNRFELLKWAFLFWVGQVVSIVGTIALMLRTIPAH